MLLLALQHLPVLQQLLLRLLLQLLLSLLLQQQLLLLLEVLLPHAALCR